MKVLALLLLFLIVSLGLILYNRRDYGKPELFFIPEITTPTVHSEPTPIPKVLYAFWDKPDVPKFIKMCFDTWVKHNPDYTIIFLNKESVSKYLPDIDFGSMNLKSHQQFSDMLRMHLLEKNGGIWIDASTIVNKSLNWVHEMQAKNNAEYVGYYQKAQTKLENSPMVENWFMASVPGSQFISDWKAEFLRMPLFDDACKYVDSLEDEGIIFNRKFHIGCYLSMHAACQKVLQQNERVYNLELITAEEDAFKYLVESFWNDAFGVKRVMNGQYKDTRINKITRHGRKVIENMSLATENLHL
jgi:hypothetical protein